MAQEALERYLVLRKYFIDGQHIYQNFDYKLPALLDLINKGWVVDGGLTIVDPH